MNLFTCKTFLFIKILSSFFEKGVGINFGLQLALELFQSTQQALDQVESSTRVLQNLHIYPFHRYRYEYLSKRTSLLFWCVFMVFEARSFIEVKLISKSLYSFDRWRCLAALHTVLNPGTT